MDFQPLWPPGDLVEIESFIDGLDFASRAHAQLPYTVVNFISSLDGRASVGGRSSALGDDGDKAVFRALRRAADAVLVGTGTLGVERYGRIVADPQARERRSARGLPGEPLACTLTRTGSLPLDIPLFAEPEAEVVVFSGQDVDLTGVRARVEVVRLEPEELRFATALAHLRTERGVRTLLCEGGPRVFATLLRERLVDELCLSLAPKLAGGGVAPAITRGPELPGPASVRLDGVLERAGTLFLRYGFPR
ncbi:MAG: dihydrofolate reductase family protein [Solirubrobacteraceae bacterium]